MECARLVFATRIGCWDAGWDSSLATAWPFLDIKQRRIGAAVQTASKPAGNISTEAGIPPDVEREFRNPMQRTNQTSSPAGQFHHCPITKWMNLLTSTNNWSI